MLHVFGFDRVIYNADQLSMSAVYFKISNRRTICGLKWMQSAFQRLHQLELYFMLGTYLSKCTFRNRRLSTNNCLHAFWNFKDIHSLTIVFFLLFFFLSFFQILRKNYNNFGYICPETMHNKCIRRENELIW